MKTKQDQEAGRIRQWFNPKNAFLVLISSLLMALNINSFIASAGIYPGGFTGLTLLVQRIAEKYCELKIPFIFINYPLNLILILLSVRVLGKRLIGYTVITFLLTGFFVDIIPTIVITQDVLLSCVFGGIINGFSMGLCLLANSSGGGSDIIGILISKKLNRDPWNYILAGNVVMLLIAGFLLGWNQALYSIIFQFTATQVLQFLYQKYKRHTLFIITNFPAEVYRVIDEITSHGATMLHGRGCYKNEERNLVYSVVSSMEVKDVLREIKRVDKDAFINVIRTDQLDGHFDQE